MEKSATMGILILEMVAQKIVSLRNFGGVLRNKEISRSATLFIVETGN